MLVKCNQGDFNFEIPEHFKKVGIKISGGIDSALLFYLLSKYKKTEKRGKDLNKKIPVFIFLTIMM